MNRSFFFLVLLSIRFPIVQLISFVTRLHWVMLFDGRSLSLNVFNLFKKDYQIYSQTYIDIFQVILHLIMQTELF